MKPLAAGDMAPDFELPADGGRVLRLSSFRGSIVVLFFYPKDNTEACTAEAIDFSMLKPAFDAIGAVVIGISPDSLRKHDNFRKKHGLSVVLASDTDRDVIDRYGLWVEKTMYGRRYMGVQRSTLLISPEGRVVRSWSRVKVAGHAAEVLAAARLAT